MSWVRSLVPGGLAVGLVLTGSVLAQPVPRVEGRRQVEGRANVSAHRYSEIVGSRVNVQGDLAVGKVTDVILNEDGSAQYLVIASEDKYVLVPWSAATMDFARRSVVVDIPKERYQEVPTFTQDQWPNLNDTHYTEKLQTYYNVRPNKERRNERREERRP